MTTESDNPELPLEPKPEAQATAPPPAAEGEPPPQGDEAPELAEGAGSAGDRAEAEGRSIAEGAGSAGDRAEAEGRSIAEGAGSAGDRAEAEGRSIGDETELQEAAQTELQQLKEAARFVTPERAVQVLEALFFAAEKPLDLQALQDTTQFDKEVLQAALQSLQQLYAPGGARGVVLLDLGGRWQLRTEPQIGAYVRRLLQVKPLRLTRAALETLAIVAYRQPITRPEMEDLRGVDCGAVTRALLERKLIRILGKKDEPGRPLLYGTTREFLELFNLRDLTQLPTLREFQELSEESRRIVEEVVAPSAPPVAGLTELQQDPQVEERIAQAAMESETALAQLESAMEQAEETTRSAAAVLAPPPPPPGTVAPAQPAPGSAPDAAPASAPKASPGEKKD